MIFNVANCKKVLGAGFEIQARGNGQISVGIARDRLSGTTDNAKHTIMVEAHTKLQTAGFPVGTFDENFKAANPPLPGAESKVWRSYFHLLLDPPAGAGAGTVVQQAVDPGPEYLKVLLSSGVPLDAAMAAVEKLKGVTGAPAAAPPASTPVVDADADPEIPV